MRRVVERANRGAVQNEREDRVVKTAAAEPADAVRGDDLVRLSRHPQERGIERAAPEVVDDEVLALRIRAPVTMRVLEACGGGLVEKRFHFKAAGLQRLERQEALGCRRVRGHGHGGLERFVGRQPRVRSLDELTVERGEKARSEVEKRQTPGTDRDLGLRTGGVESALERPDDRPAGLVPHGERAPPVAPFARPLLERHERRHEIAAIERDDGIVPAVHERDDGVRGAEVDAESHAGSLVKITLMTIPRAFSTAAWCALASPAALLAQVPVNAGTSATMVVSATKASENALDVAAPVFVVSGDELRRHGAKTVAEALQDVVGLDAGGGSDNGSRLANIGVWGLKEFDALLVTVDGVPVGGPFNPSLAQISIEDIDRIEIVKGPQGTLYGVSAFAGMIQVFTRHPKEAGGALTLGGGSFSDKHGNLSYTASQGDQTIRLFGSMARNKGWQDGTDVSSDRLSLGYTQRTKEGSVDVTASILRDTNYFGSPLPVDAGQPVPGFEIDRNYAIGGGRLDHRVYSLPSTISQPLSKTVRLENTLGLARDEQIAVRSFIVGSDGTTATATGTSVRPLETTLYDDARIVANFTAGGHQRLVAGIAYTTGKTTLDGTG